MKNFLIIFLIIISFALVESANALTLYPSRLEASLNPGQNKQYDIALYNETNEDLYLNGVLTPFGTNNEDGLPVFGEYTGDKTFLNWIKLPVNSFVLKPKETKKLKLNINVPSSGKPGGYYFASIWNVGSNQSEPGSQVSISGRVGTLVLLKVQGDSAKEKIEVKDFYLDRTSFFKPLPVNFFVKIANEGNVHIKPAGKLVIKNIFGKVVDNATFNKNGLNILPTSVRKMESSWNGKPLSFGLYKARLDIEYGELNNRITTKEIFFWVMPWWIIIILTIIIIVIIILLGKVFKNRKNK